MTKLMKRAMERASKLPKHEQDAIASLVLDELDSESRWSALFADTSKLRRLAAAARAEHEAGRTEELDPDRL